MSIPFQKPTENEVYALIQKELKDISLDSLQIQPTNGVLLQPIYNKAHHTIHIPNILDYRIIFQYYSLAKTNIIEINQRIIQDLTNGQNGLLLNFNNEIWSETEISLLFEGIRMDYIHIEFCETNDEMKSIILNYISIHYPNLNWSHIFFKEHFRYIENDNFIENAANLLLQFNDDKAFIYIELSGDYFWDIAKVRAFKTILYNHRLKDGLSPNFILIGESSKKNKSKDNQENNLIKLTTEAMSAMIGGCEGLWIRPFNGDYSQEFSTRISRNIFHLLQEESYIHLVKDISQGSYFIENYTEQIAKQIYSKLD